MADESKEKKTNTGQSGQASGQASGHLTGRWTAEAAGILAREVSAGMVLEPAEQLPLAADSVCFRIPASGAVEGELLVMAERAGLHALLQAAGLAGAETPEIEDWEVELWQGVVGQAAAAALGAQTGTQVGPAEPADWERGVPAAALEVRLESAMMRVAVADRTRATAPPPAAPGPQPVAAAPAALPPGIELLVDVELEASLRFGSREMSLNEVLDLGPGDVIELDRHIAEPVDLLVGDRIVARGEVVLVDGNFGLTVLEVATAEKRLESIRCLF